MGARLGGNEGEFEVAVCFRAVRPNMVDSWMLTVRALMYDEKPRSSKSWNHENWPSQTTLNPREVGGGCRLRDALVILNWKHF